MNEVQSATRPDDVAACSDALNGGSRSFYAASRLLPGRFARDAAALYAFCRMADDLIDHCEPRTNPEQGQEHGPEHGPDQSRGNEIKVALASLHQRLDQLYEGMPFASPADRAMRQVVVRHGLPRALLAALFEGFEWDANERRYESIDDVFDYGARVAGSVGVMMAMLMGVRSADMLARAADLGVAMQLTNIARDVGEDARNGRLYLPGRWLREEGVDPDRFLAHPRFSAAIGRVVARLLCVADKLYARADSGLTRLPIRYRPGMAAARLLYWSIGEEIRRAGCDSVTRRAVVSPANKALVLARLPGLLMQHTTDQGAPALEQTLYLVRIAALDTSVRSADKATPGGALANVTWVLNLFDELDRRDAGPLVARRNQ